MFSRLTGVPLALKCLVRFLIYIFFLPWDRETKNKKNQERRKQEEANTTQGTVSLLKFFKAAEPSSQDSKVCVCVCVCLYLAYI